MDLKLRLESFQYPGSRPLFRSFEFSIFGGQSVAFVGSSGSGKSSIVQILAGLHPSPLGGLVQGSLLIDSRDVRSLSPSEHVNSLGYLGADPPLFLTGMSETVREEIGWSLSSTGWTGLQQRLRIEEALERFRLTHLSKLQPDRLSGGEQQLVCLASVWARQPLVLLLDEPTSKLDPTNRKIIRQAIKGLLEEGQLSVVWSSSQLDEVSWCDRFFSLPKPEDESAISEKTLEQLSRDKSAHFRLPKWQQLGLELQLAEELIHREQSLQDSLETWTYEQKKIALSTLEAPALEPESRPESLAQPLDLKRATFLDPGLRKPRLSSVDLHIEPGEWLAIIGPNGSGKTTLAKSLRGILEVTSGTVHLGRERVSRTRLAALAEELHYTFQDPEELFIGSTVREEFLISGEFLGLEESRAEERLLLSADLFSLGDTLETHPRELSSSTKALLAIALGWFSNAPVQILDEPTARLDREGLRILDQALTTWHREQRTVILLDHDLDWLLKVCDRFVFLDNGAITADLNKREVFRSNPDLPLIEDSERWLLYRAIHRTLQIREVQE